jgi:hypothetical protein
MVAIARHHPWLRVEEIEQVGVELLLFGDAVLRSRSG